MMLSRRQQRERCASYHRSTGPRRWWTWLGKSTGGWGDHSLHIQCDLMQHSYPRLYGRRPLGARGDADKGARSRNRLSERLAASGDGRQSYNIAGANNVSFVYMLCDLDRTGTEDRAIRDPGTNPFKCKGLRTCVTYWRVGSRLKALQA